ncbi:MAG TPA: type I DNA topoisomerase [Gemmatimonadales bacterium]|nr:type I DNA topoisomerase [Gemmatimonadales bacterium]
MPSTKKKATKPRKRAAGSAPSKPALKPATSTGKPARGGGSKPRTKHAAGNGAAADGGRRRGGSLVIVESPTKAKTIGKYLGSGYAVKATVGHVRDLPTRKLGVDIEGGTFTPEYVIIKGKSQTLSEIKKAARSAREVFLATDPDREGEAIAWHVASQLDRSVPTHRVLFHEITRDAVKAAMRSPGDIDEQKVNAQQARRILDRLVGYKASPLLWKSIKTGLSAGRVQTVALRLIVERERGIRAFKPQEYWSIEALCAADGQEFEASLHKVDGHKPQLHSADDARKVIEAVLAGTRSDQVAPAEPIASARSVSTPGLTWTVSSVERKQRHKRPGAPFTTSTLQQEAAKRLGFSSRRTMRAAQDLYEGIDIGAEGPVGLITYMRTDSVRVSDAAIKSVRDFIAANYAKAYLPDAPNQYSARRAAKVQDAHEAIRPTDVRHRPEDVQPFLEPDQFRLYQLIWQRFVASQMMPAVYDMTIVDFDLGKYLFRATGSVLVFDGYHVLYLEGREPEDGKAVEDLSPIPALERGDKVGVEKITPNQHFTEPPPRFSEASLVKELERLGIGRPSTYSAIISTLSAREYVKIESRRFFPTSLGETVERVMVSKFPEIFDVGFTAGMETELDKIEEGELPWQRVLSDFYDPFTRALEAVDINALVAEAHGLSPERLASERCPKCGRRVELRTGRFGPYLACEKYKDGCDYAKSLRKDKAPDRPTDAKCHLCQAPMVIKTGRFGEFLACTRYPECKGTRAVPLGMKCPKCLEGDLAERRTKRGKSFWGCVRYPACDFSTWNRPVAEECPTCGWVGLERKVTKAEGEVRTCLKCGHRIVAVEPEEMALT